MTQNKLPIFQLVYTSTLDTDDPGNLRNILDSAVQNNQRDGITGVFLYSDGNVMQVLEGHKTSVLHTFSVIKSDLRHTNIFVLLQQDVALRQFASWSMGFANLTKDALNEFPTVADVFGPHQDASTTQRRAKSALAILNSFAEGAIPVG